MIVDLPTPLAPRKASVRLPVAYAAIASSPVPVRPLVSSTGTPRATSTSSATRRRRVVDEVGLGQHHDRLGARVERQHELAFEPALVGRGVEGVDEEDDVDVGGDRLGLEAGALERRPSHERRVAVDDVLHPLAVAMTARPNHRPPRRRRCCGSAAGSIVAAE